MRQANVEPVPNELSECHLYHSLHPLKLKLTVPIDVARKIWLPGKIPQNKIHFFQKLSISIDTSHHNRPFHAKLVFLLNESSFVSLLSLLPT